MTTAPRRRNYKSFYADDTPFCADNWMTPGTPVRQAFDERVPEDAFVTFIERHEDGTLSIAWSFEQPGDYDHWISVVKTWLTLRLDGSATEFLSYPNPDEY